MTIANAAASTATPSGNSKPIRLTEAELASARSTALAAFNDPTRPLIDTMGGAEDSAGVRYACSNVYGKGVSGIPFAGRFVSGGFQIISKGGDFSSTNATNMLCSKLHILPRRIDP
jgi:hypothetical protein